MNQILLMIGVWLLIFFITMIIGAYSVKDEKELPSYKWAILFVSFMVASIVTFIAGGIAF